MLPFRLFPRPSILTSMVVATSVLGGLAFGMVAGGVVVLASTRRRS